MRRTLLILSALLLVSAPVAAETANNPNGRVFGSVNCQQRLPCAGDGSLSPADYVASANSCITQHFGYTNPNGFFEEMAGMGTDSCLSAKPNSIPKGIGNQLSPRCCIVRTQEDACIFHCDLIQ